MPYPKDEQSLKFWEEALSHAIAKDPDPWNAYDPKIQMAVQQYNDQLRGISNFQPLDWQVIKAMTWVESGANSSKWKSAPMQIGLNGDPGLRDLLTSPQGKMILPQQYARTLTLLNVHTDGEKNIQAGTGYLLMVLAKFAMVPVAPVPAKGATLPAIHS